MAGTGKTLLVEKLAAEGGLPLLALAPSSVLSKWAGDSEKTLKKVRRLSLTGSTALSQSQSSDPRKARSISLVL